eukprot:760659-Hanusia_phi.AAC.7
MRINLALPIFLSTTPVDHFRSAKMKGMKGFVDDFEDVYGQAKSPSNRTEGSRKQRKPLSKSFGRVSRIRGILKGQSLKKKKKGAGKGVA